MNTNQVQHLRFIHVFHPAAVSIIAWHRHQPFSRAQRVMKDELAFSFSQQSSVRRAQRREAEDILTSSHGGFNFLLC